MTSCVLSAFFFVSLVSSFAAVDSTGIKIRITNRALDVLKDFGLEYLLELVNHHFPDFTIDQGNVKCTIRGMIFTRLWVHPDGAVVRFQENSGLRFEINDLAFMGELDRELNLCLFQRQIFSDTRSTVFLGRGVRVTIGVELTRNPQGQLHAEIPTCEVTADDIMTSNNGIMGPFWNLLEPVYKYLFNNKLCPAILDNVVPKINTMLESMTMKVKLHEDYDINMDYRVSNDITVNANCLDVPFQGIIYGQEEIDPNTIQQRVDPVFTETDRMAYVGVSELTLNSAALALYNAGPFQIEIPEMHKIIESIVLKPLGFRKGPLNVELVEAPAVSISAEGVFVIVKARAQSLKEPVDNNRVIPMVCKFKKMKVDIKGNHLVLLPKSSAKCEVQPENIWGRAPAFLAKIGSKKPIKGYLKTFFGEGLLIPLPDGVIFTEGNVSYQDGFVVVGGYLNFTPARMHQMARGFSR